MKTGVVCSRALAIVWVMTMLSGSPGYASPEIPGAPQQAPVALVGGTIHPVSGPEITNGIVLFSEGKIVAVGTDVALPGDVQKIDLAGRHVYPGLIDAYTHLGLVEIPAVRATRDQSETGQINPNSKALVAINPDSELIPVARSNGVLAVLTAPNGGLISGCSALVQLDGWTWEEMSLVPGVGMHLNWPRMAPSQAWWVEASAEQQLSERDRNLELIRSTFADARVYQAAKTAHLQQGAPAPDFDARWEAMIPLLEGRVPLMVHADDLEQIQAALAFAERERIKVILIGGYDAPHCAELLKKLQVTVIVAGVNRLPRRPDDAYDTPFAVPARLHEAGIKFCISSDDNASSVRNLPYHAGVAAAYGLPPDEALKAITLYPAEILGVADRLGTLEAGKDATLIVTSGDPLEIPSQVSMAFIQGRPIQLSDRPKRLWEKYKEKYRRLGIDNP